MGPDDDQGGCIDLLLRENPYSTKAAENVTGRQINAKLAETNRAVLVIKLKQWHCFTWSLFLPLKCHKDPLETKCQNNPLGHLCISII